MAQHTQHEIAVAMSTAVSSPSLHIAPRECSTWLFGGCGPEQSAQDMLDTIAKYHGLPDWDGEYHSAVMIEFLTKLIGSEMAIAADQHILTQFEE